jgi:triosephosphate isomerase
MRKKLLVANWKMNKSFKELEPFVSTLHQKGYDKFIYAEIVVAPSFPYLMPLHALLETSSIQLGAQNAFWEPKGAYTGEVSFNMLKDFGVHYVILGHSERRQFFKESDEDVAKKTKACIECKIIPIVCVGESLEERNTKQTFAVIERQVHAVLENLSHSEGLVFAYEPIWAIGTGVSATVVQAQEVHSFIRNLLEKRFSHSESERVRILYGGSMNASNSRELFQQKDIDGGLIGGASLDAESFLDILKTLTI